MSGGMAADIAHLRGFLTGAALYALLLVMVRANAGSIRSAAGEMELAWRERACLPLYIAVLGLFWNLVSLASMLVGEITTVIEPALLSVLAISALGGLPAVTIHSVWQVTAGGITRRLGLLVFAGYGLSVAVALWNGLALISGDPVPDVGAWRMLTIAFLVLFFALLLAMKPMLVGHSGLVLALLAFSSVVALPLSHHVSGSLPWWSDFLGHHASLPVAVAMLYQDYRFVFVDRFMKRAFPFPLLVGTSCGLYVAVVLPFIEGGTHGTISPVLSGLIITLWVATAVVYPWARQKVTWVLDTLVLFRPDYGELRDHLAQRMNEHDTLEGVLGELCQGLQKALRSREVRWERTAYIPVLPSLSETHLGTAETTGSPWRGEAAASVQTNDAGLTMVVSTLEVPRCVVAIAPRTDGHRFLSEEWLLVEAAAVIAARRIDVLRTSHEGCEIAFREQEMQKLTTKPELRALRAQVVWRSHPANQVLPTVVPATRSLSRATLTNEGRGCHLVRSIDQMVKTPM